MQQTILAIDTSTEACSVALQYGKDVISRYEVLPRGHAQRILPMIDEVLAQAELATGALSLIAFCQGPGSFTGVRIAASVAQGLAFAHDLPVAPVSTLATLAQGALRELASEQVLAAIDARMGEVYWGRYRAVEGIMVLEDSELVVKPDEVPVPATDGWTGVGTGWGTYEQLLRERCGQRVQAVQADRLPQARDLIALAAVMAAADRLVAAEAAVPVYLRDNVTS